MTKQYRFYLVLTETVNPILLISRTFVGAKKILNNPTIAK